MKYDRIDRMTLCGFKVRNFTRVQCSGWLGLTCNRTQVIAKRTKQQDPAQRPGLVPAAMTKIHGYLRSVILFGRGKNKGFCKIFQIEMKIANF